MKLPHLLFLIYGDAASDNYIPKSSILKVIKHLCLNVLKMAQSLVLHVVDKSRTFFSNIYYICFLDF